MLIEQTINDVLVNRIALLITWILFIIAILKYTQDKKQNERNVEKHRRELEAENEKLIKRVCREFVQDIDYVESKEKRMRELAQMEINQAFSLRAESFVDAKEYKADRRNFSEGLKRIEEQIAKNTTQMAELTGKLAQIVLVDRRNPRITDDGDLFEDTLSRRKK